MKQAGVLPQHEQAMNIVRAAETDLPRIRGLIHSARYRYADYGVEDLPALLSKAECMLGQDMDGPWGFIAVQVEARPATLPASAPARAYLRALALRAGHPPRQFLEPLLSSVEEVLRTRREPLQVITYGGEAWMANGLTAASFHIVDQVQFFRLDRLDRLNRRSHVTPEPAGPARLHLARAADLEPLAQLDAAAFPPLWHFGYQDMLELLMRSRLQIAWQADRPVGYAALIANSAHEAQLARLAVHPAVQRSGIGRQLLEDAVRYAAGAGYETVTLNTQTDNYRSQRLYRAFGFQPIADPIAVMARLLG